MESLKRTRRPHRTEATRLVTEINALLEAPEKDQRKIRIKLKLLLEEKEKILDLDDKILNQHVEDKSEEKAEEDELKSIREYREKIETAIDHAEEVLKISRPASPSPNDSSSTSTKMRSFKLPEIELKKYSGDLKEWLGFWSQFKKIHEDVTLHGSDKFDYLLQAMEKGSPAREVVESYPQSEENYQKAVDALTERFGNKDLLLQVYVRELLKLVITNVTSRGRIPLSTLYLKLDSHLRSLQTLDLATADPATWLFPLVESSLDSDTLRTWQRSPQMKIDENGGVDKSRLDLLMNFLKTEVQIEQRIEVVQTGFQHNSQDFKKPHVPARSNKLDKRKREREEREESLPTAAGLLSTYEVVCIFCDGKHDSKDCGNAKKMTMEEKQLKIKEKNACFSCLRPGHSKKRCRAFVSCHLCPKKHVTIMCPLLNQTWSQESPRRDQYHNQGGQANQQIPASGQWDQTPQSTSHQGSSMDCVGDILMMTVKVNVSVVKGAQPVTKRLLIDTGCQRSAISKRLVDEIKCRPFRTEMSRNILFDGSVTKFAKTNLHKVTISGLNGKQSLQLVLREKPKLGGGIPLAPVGPWMKTLQSQGIWITDTGNNMDRAEVDIVIGSDYWWQIKTGNEHKITPQLGATETIFGWAISGTLPHVQSEVDEQLSLFQMEEDFTRLWSMEAIGINDPILKLSKQEEEAAAMNLFKQTTSRQADGRYKVKLPWMNGPQALPTNRNVAEKRLNSTTKRLEQMGHYEAYNKIFMDWLAEDIIEEVKDPLVMEEKNQCHYVCHHPVFKDSPTTPTRPVFDASCKVGRNPSLNDCLYKGPNFIELLPSVIMRFRENRLGVVADIRKAFQMIVIAEEDQDYLRFLWWEQKGNKIKVFRHKRVVFGVNCSPFLLAAVLDLHLSTVPDSQDVAMKLSHSMYVDNCVTSVNDYEEYTRFRTEAVHIMNLAKMDLRQWEITPCTSDSIPSNNNMEQGKDDKDSCATTKVLGMILNKVDDTLSVHIPVDLKIAYSKRGILSVVSKIFDPIGFTCPAVFTGKVLFQQAWKCKGDWDSELDGQLRHDFQMWIDEIAALKDIKVPRHHQVYQAQTKELHLFCDGSQLGYASVVYLKSKAGEQVKVQLIQAKARVAPPDKMTIPRIELCACLIGARLIDSVKEALNMQDVATYLWSDSTTAIAWIRRNDDWGTFVGNRVKKILEVTNPEDWRHVKGVMNPADLPSRGCSPSELFQSRWWEGPAWLKMNSAPYPSSSEQCNEEMVNLEKKKTNMGLMEVDSNEWYSPKFSSYLKNVKVFGWVRRFISNTRNGKAVTSKYLQVCEIRRAELDLIKIIQQDFQEDKMKSKLLPVVESEDGILRVKTALILKNDTTEFCWPILLPGKHRLVDLLIIEAHLTYGHVGTQRLMGILRERYWITQTRKSVKRIIGKCVTCQRYNSKACVVVPAPLPPSRVNTGEVFMTVGVDLAGPLFIKNKQKVWIILFTCAVYRCVWLDLVTSLDSKAFIMALERFIAIHGRPSTIYSDNGTNFVGANNLFSSMKWEEIQRESEVKQIKWIFNPPTASWWGGFWERLVKSVKDLLRRMLGRSKLDFEELRTCLAGVASAINERPLTTVSEDPNDFQPLTPAMFMKGTRGSSFPEGGLISPNDFKGQYEKLSRMRDSLQARFRKEYLAMMVRKPVYKQTLLTPGKLVLIGSDNKKRYNWPIGRVEELIPGRDGHIRTVKVKTANGIVTRPLQRAFPLELPEIIQTLPSNMEKRLQEAMVSDRGPEPEVKRSRFGRKLNKPVHYSAFNF